MIPELYGFLQTPSDISGNHLGIIPIWISQNWPVHIGLTQIRPALARQENRLQYFTPDMSRKPSGKRQKSASIWLCLGNSLTPLQPATRRYFRISSEQFFTGTHGWRITIITPSALPPPLTTTITTTTHHHHHPTNEAEETGKRIRSVGVDVRPLFFLF